jgi:folate-dependent phosphoribosylglycinamide formyltransferase PurN
MSEPVKTSEIKPIYEPSGGGPMSIAVFLSGTGTNFTAIYEVQKRLEREGAARYGRIDAVFTNAPKCKGALRAAEEGIPVLSLSSSRYFDALARSADDEEARDYYDAASITLVEQVCAPDIIVLAGYRRRLGSMLLNRYENMVINLYPGDITKDYLVRGIDASVQALRAGEKSISCTVYVQKENERFGPALVRSQPVSLKGFREKDADALNERIRSEGEWKIYPFAVHEIIAGGRVGIDPDDNIYIDGVKVGEGGYEYGE